MYRPGIKAWPEGAAKVSFEFVEGLLLPRFLRFRPELGAPAFPAAGGAHRVPSVALHADHLVQPAVFGLGETGHMEARPGWLKKASGPRSLSGSDDSAVSSYVVFCGVARWSQLAHRNPCLTANT